MRTTSNSRNGPHGMPSASLVKAQGFRTDIMNSLKSTPPNSRVKEKCNYEGCDYEHTYERDVFAHFLSVHVSEPVFVCVHMIQDKHGRKIQCGKAYRREKSLLQHLNENHHTTHDDDELQEKTTAETLRRIRLQYPNIVRHKSEKPLYDLIRGVVSIPPATTHTQHFERLAEPQQTNVRHETQQPTIAHYPTTTVAVPAHMHPGHPFAPSASSARVAAPAPAPSFHAVANLQYYWEERPTLVPLDKLEEAYYRLYGEYRGAPSRR
ncbi:uncharacterized protein TRAVEDRAFT_24646 [Trametes versicolor FP-101664 SS1]|uniref:uncharacterized protein n=1 Tax=Trametes versicolor (strain FP-101664) TaxID=717944 RepID=UPI0004621A8D|nr:uncharacterized protein TRAVEDRAFT_24646 [Trametes versicolor FP-101664 SS1]EIW52456.1 hypothetical protein TRAVEDRAFT_24646 [Trametes versicolor FP-101664 SS1]